MTMIRTTKRTTLRAVLATAAAITAAVALSACAPLQIGGGAGGRDLPDDVNMADVMFVEMMIPHHAQAIEMADIVLDADGVDPQVVALAEEIKAAQGPEIELMESWLDDWGLPSMGGAPGGHGGGHGMDGMMSEEDLESLAAADGPDASRLFLEQMVEHHEGAIEMAQEVIDDGENADVRSLAETIIETQQVEIDLMRELLG